MNKYYCHECAISLGLYTPSESYNLTGTIYQLGKIMKHNQPTGTFPFLNSVYNDPTIQQYIDYHITGSLAGMLEIDQKGRKNIIWYAGREIGVIYENGNYLAPADGVKIVLSEDPLRIHHYAIAGNPNSIQYCINCGKPLPQW